MQAIQISLVNVSLGNKTTLDPESSIVKISKFGAFNLI